MMRQRLAGTRCLRGPRERSVSIIQRRFGGGLAQERDLLAGRIGNARTGGDGLIEDFIGRRADAAGRLSGTIDDCRRDPSAGRPHLALTAIEIEHEQANGGR
jgi:hypothetical protein